MFYLLITNNNADKEYINIGNANNLKNSRYEIQSHDCKKYYVKSKSENKCKINISRPHVLFSLNVQML